MTNVDVPDVIFELTPFEIGGLEVKILTYDEDGANPDFYSYKTDREWQGSGYIYIWDGEAF